MLHSLKCARRLDIDLVGSAPPAGAGKLRRHKK
jgi:hypothetical protein